jgi:ankyrin repeat protein
MKNEIDQDLLSAVASNLPALVETLLKNGVDCNARYAGGVTPLHFTSERYSVEAARVLLDHGADVNAQDIYGNTPLARAVYRSKRGTEPELVKLLMSRGANPDIKNKAGESARDLVKGNAVLERLLQK